MRTLAFAILVALSTTAVACSGTSADIDDESAEETTGDAEGALTAKEHLVPGDVDLAWVPGCGVAPPHGGTCYMGLALTYTKSYRDLKVSIKTSVNNSAGTLTIKLDTYSNGGPHILAPVSPETKDLGMPKRLNMSRTYHAKVVDWQNNVLWSGDITTMPAA